MGSVVTQRRRVKKKDAHRLPPEVILPPAPVDDDKPGITIMDLNSNTCRQVIGVGDDKLARYCGDKTKSGSWCCPGHHAINYQPAWR